MYSPPGIMAVDVVRCAGCGVPVQTAGLAIVRGGHALPAQVCLSSSAHVITLVAADEAALITRSESRRDHTACIAYLGVPKRRLSVQALVSGNVGTLVARIVDVGKVIDAVARARVHHHPMAICEGKKAQHQEHFSSHD